VDVVEGLLSQCASLAQHAYDDAAVDAGARELLEAASFDIDTADSIIAKLAEHRARQREANAPQVSQIPTSGVVGPDAAAGSDGAPQNKPDDDSTVDAIWTECAKQDFNFKTSGHKGNALGGRWARYLNNKKNKTAKE